MADIGAAVAALDAICLQLDNALLDMGKPLRSKADLRHRHCENVDVIQRGTRIAASEALSRCVGTDDAKAMLEDPRHSLWGKEDLSEAVQEALNLSPRPRATLALWRVRKHKKVEELIGLASHHLDLLAAATFRLLVTQAPQAQENNIAVHSAKDSTAGSRAQIWPHCFKWVEIQHLAEVCRDALLHSITWKCDCKEDGHKVNVLLQHRFSSTPADDDQCKTLKLAVSSGPRWIQGELTLMKPCTPDMGHIGPCDAWRTASEQDYVRLQVLLDGNGKPARLCRLPSGEQTQPSVPYMEFKPEAIVVSDRMSMKVVMASSVIQLGLTPLLGRFWTFEDMLFRCAAGNDELLLREPFLSWPHKKDPGMIGFGGKSQRSQQNATMLSLAFLVAQLSFKGTLPLEMETSRLKQSWKDDHDGLRTTLHEWVNQNEVRNRLGEVNLAVIDHCLKCFGQPGFDLREASVVDDVLKHVVWPLQVQKASTFF
ncbi:hypothetical protein KC318_g9745 [Hortaea werneckii]|nr:hypothetical protein KC334_g4148 [Hortaea werneckii]KAI7007049.1 hypothetical protein KC355_g7479 [Hortaea werneckii]KAI7660952.1 hypothetical protein KC318_g9745 [Hortaea werneckii]